MCVLLSLQLQVQIITNILIFSNFRHDESIFIIYQKITYSRLTFSIDIDIGINRGIFNCSPLDKFGR